MPQVFKRADTGRKQEEYQLVGSFDHEPSEWRAACPASVQSCSQEPHAKHCRAIRRDTTCLLQMAPRSRAALSQSVSPQSQGGGGDLSG